MEEKVGGKNDGWFSMIPKFSLLEYFLLLVLNSRNLSFNTVLWRKNKQKNPTQNKQQQQQKAMRKWK